MTKTIKQVLERVRNKGFNDRCQQEKHADIDNQFVVALPADQALKEIEAIIRTEKLKLLDRLESKASYDPSGRSPLINPLEIQAERNKLEKEW